MIPSTCHVCPPRLWHRTAQRVASCPDMLLISLFVMFLWLRETSFCSTFLLRELLHLKTWLQYYLSPKFSPFPQLLILGRITKLPLSYIPFNPDDASIIVIIMCFCFIISQAILMIENHHPLLVRDFGWFICLPPVKSLACGGPAIYLYKTKTHFGSLLAYVLGVCLSTVLAVVSVGFISVWQWCAAMVREAIGDI